MVIGRLMLLGALLATAGLLAACSPFTSDAGPGPLGDGGDPGQQCMPWPQGKPTGVGLYDFTNSSTSPVIVKSVRLASPRGLKMSKDAWFVPIYYHDGTYNTVGVGWPWPLSLVRHYWPVQWAWARRKPAIGFVIKPHVDIDLVFGLTRTEARNAYSGGPVLTYSANGTTYTVRSQTTLQITPARSC
jgi:hypothetical protein